MRCPQKELRFLPVLRFLSEPFSLASPVRLGKDFAARVRNRCPPFRSVRPPHYELPVSSKSKWSGRFASSVHVLPFDVALAARYATVRAALDQNQAQVQHDPAIGNGGTRTTSKQVVIARRTQQEWQSLAVDPCADVKLGLK